MENVDKIIAAVSTVGWPIVCTLIMMWMMWTMMQSHKEEMAKVTEALHNNTAALVRLEERLKG